MLNFKITKFSLVSFMANPILVERCSKNLLVVEHNVWQPYSLAGNIESFDSAIIIWVPLQLVVIPLLQQQQQQQQHSSDSSELGTATWSTHTLVVITWFFRSTSMSWESLRPSLTVRVSVKLDTGLMRRL